MIGDIALTGNRPNLTLDLGSNERLSKEILEVVTSLENSAELIKRLRMITSIEAYGGLGNKMGIRILKAVGQNPQVFKFNDVRVNLYNTNSSDVLVALKEAVSDPSALKSFDIYEVVKGIPPEFRKRIRFLPVGATTERVLLYYKAIQILQNANEFPPEVVEKANRVIDEIANELNGSGGRMEVGMKLADKSKEVIRLFTALEEPDFRIGVGSMGGGGTATALFPFHAEIMYQTTPNSIVIENAIMPFADEGSEKFEQFKKSSEMTKPFVNLLIFHNPQKYVGKRITFSTLEEKLVEKPIAFVSALTRVVTPTKEVKMLIDKADIKSTFGEKGENVGDILYVDNRTQNGGYMDVIKMAEEKVELNIKPDVLLIIFEIPKNHDEVYGGSPYSLSRGEHMVTLDDVLEATDIIKSGADVKRVLRGVYEVERSKPVINAYIVATKKIKEAPNSSEKLMDFFDAL